VAEHVVPVLYGDSVTRDEFRMSLFEFLHEQHDPVIVADWYTDLMHFSSASKVRIILSRCIFR
jgi:hypothetical protein